MKRRVKRRGQALLEMTFLLPFLLFLVANVVNYGGMFFAAITVANAARHASQNFVYGSATIKNGATPTPAEVWDLAGRDLLALPNQGSLVLRICLENRNNPSNPACSSFGSGSAVFTNPPIDPRPEGNAYLNGWVDVGYTYTPYIPLFTVPILGISLSPPPQAMVRQSLMRVLN